MKRLVPTLILVVICIAGFWYASAHDFFREPKEEPVPLVAVSKDDVQSFTIKNNDENSGDAALITLEKKDGAWTMTQPASYPLNSYGADSWVNAIIAVKGDKKLEDDPSNLAEYGLDKPKLEYTVTLKDGSVKKLFVGNTTPIPEYMFVKTSDSPAVYQASLELLNPLKKEPFDFLEKSPFQFEYNKLKVLTVEWGGKQWTLTKKDPSKMGYESEWKLGDLDLSASDGSSFLDRMINISTSSMVRKASEVNTEGAELKVSIIEEKDGKDIPSTYLGKIDANQNDIWIVKQGGDWAYVIPVATAQNLYDKADEIRSKVEQEKNSENSQ
jgi:hypothetical protein